MTSNGSLPLVITVTDTFSKRLPSQRVCDLIRHCEPGMTFGDIGTEQPFRLIAFRALLRDFPAYDTTAVWLHSYDVEVDVVEEHPTQPVSQTASLPSADTGDACLETSTS
jgi:hypothetical protein